MLCAVAERHRGADQSRGCSSTNPLMAGHAMLPISATERIDAVPHTKIDNWPTGRQPFPPRGIVRTKPRAHPSAIRTTNLPERLFVEERRRLKITPQRLRREGRPQAHVRRHDPSRRALAGPFRVSELECRQMRAVFRLSPDLPGLRDRTLFLRRDSPGIKWDKWDKWDSPGRAAQSRGADPMRAADDRARIGPLDRALHDAKLAPVARA